jgi:ribose transport system ATP-binding protein
MGDRASEIALRIDSLSKTFGANTVLRDAHLDLVPGQIHGLLGENGSGKSTLIKILSGYHEPDPGASAWLWGKKVEFPLRPGAARALGLSFVHQDLALVPEISIVENLFVSEIASGKRTLTRRQMIEAAREILHRYSINARPESPVAVLGRGDRALLAIARAVNEVSGSATESRRVLILDEPTAAMSLDEKRGLYGTFSALAESGHALMLVSHDLDEIMEVTDVVTVLRDGEVVGTVETSAATPADIVKMIIGHNIDESGQRRERTLGNVRLEAIKVNSPDLADVSLAIRSGEIVGAAGLVGSGYAELNQTLFGLKRDVSGEIVIDSLRANLRHHTPGESVRMNMGLIPIERDRAGIELELSVTDNLTVQLLGSVGDRRANWPWLSRARLKKAARDAVRRYRIKAPALTSLLKTLSGGNRQKVLLAKWLAAGKSVLLLDEPTQAVDIGAHEEILNVIDQFAREGGAALIASEDWDQLADICDRVLIFAEGSIKAELSGHELNKHAIGEACYKWGSRSIHAGTLQA